MKWLGDAGFKDLAAKPRFEIDETEFSFHFDQLGLANCPEIEHEDRTVFRYLTMGQPTPLKGIPAMVEQARTQILENAAMNRRLFIRISILVVALLLFILVFSIKGHAEGGVEGQGSSVNPALTTAACGTSALAVGIRSPLYLSPSGVLCTSAGGTGSTSVTINNTSGNAAIVTFLTSSLAVTCTGCSSASAVTVSNTTGSALFVTLLTSSLSVTSTPAAGTTTVVSFLTSTLPVSIGSTITATFLTSSLSVTSTPAAGTVAVVSFLTSTLPVSIGSTVTTTFLTSTLSVTATPAAGAVTVVGFQTASIVTAATLTAETTKVIGTVRILGNGGATVDAIVGAGTSSTNMITVGAIYNSTEISPSTGQSFALQADSKGRLRDVIMDAAGNSRGANVSASNALKVDGSAVTQPIGGNVGISAYNGGLITAAIAPGPAPGFQVLVGAAYHSTEVVAVDGDAFALQADANGRLRNVIMDAAGNTRGANVTAANQLKVDASGTTVTTTFLTSSLAVTCTGCSSASAVTVSNTVGSALFVTFLTSSLTVTSTPAAGTVTVVGFQTSSLAVTTTPAAGTTAVVSFLTSTLPVSIGSTITTTFLTSSLSVTTTPAAGAVTVIGFQTASIVTAATLTAETTKVIGTVRVTGNVGAVFDGATGAAPPANVVYMGGLNSGATGGLLGGISVCDTFGAISITTATTTLVVTGVSGRNVYICNLFLTNNAADNVAIVSGTGATCGTGTAAISGGLTPTNGIYLIANGGFSVGVGLGAVMKTKAAGDSVCIGTSAATQLSGSIGYVIY